MLFPLFHAMQGKESALTLAHKTRRKNVRLLAHISSLLFLCKSPFHKNALHFKALAAVSWSFPLLLLALFFRRQCHIFGCVRDTQSEAVFQPSSQLNALGTRLTYTCSFHRMARTLVFLPLHICTSLVSKYFFNLTAFHFISLKKAAHR